ncbi:phosphonatase-like hydrolase [Dyadobacter jiangsuensis]|uniref:Phosphonatase-like hydrolase n=1 Tax=Dyadobacter jiangsuensis TaxID=1591085 RepID=A0A2P8FQ48_9BACT|nr:phosphonatase-like hydrolase [Dyadobacter jiangsuensis]PSL23852.1 phosphonatase-like hydrolase [Dyadobacter jiangsuensis]
MIKMAVFDMAGTTVDEDNVVYKTLMRAVNERGFDFTFDEILAQGAGKEKLHAIKSVLGLRGILDSTLAEEIFERFLVMLEEAYKGLEVTEQPNASKVFAALKAKGVAVVLNTGYNRETAEDLVQKIGWEEGVHFDCLVTASEVERNRPDPDMIFWAQKKLGIDNVSEVLKVGDSKVDIEEGRNAGCRFSIGVTTGAHTEAQLREASPDFIIDNLLELIPIVESRADSMV